MVQNLSDVWIRSNSDKYNNYSLLFIGLNNFLIKLKKIKIDSVNKIGITIKS